MKDKIGNVYNDEKIITDKEARDLLCKLSNTGSGLMLSLSLAVNSCYRAGEGDREKSNRLLAAIFRDYQSALDSMFDGTARKRGCVISMRDGSDVTEH